MTTKREFSDNRYNRYNLCHVFCLFFFFVQMDPKNVTVVLEDDGTLVDSNSFFQKLPTQTVLVFLQPGEHWGGGKIIRD